MLKKNAEQNWVSYRARNMKRRLDVNVYCALSVNHTYKTQ